MTGKQCTKCGVDKEADAFYARTGYPMGLYSWCKACVRIKNAARMPAHRTKMYGLTPADYEALLERQGGCCAICGKPPTGRALDVDHCHRTGAIRGLLHSQCNLTLGRHEDDPTWFKRAAVYLDRFIA